MLYIAFLLWSGKLAKHKAKVSGLAFCLLGLVIKF